MSSRSVISALLGLLLFALPLRWAHGQPPEAAELFTEARALMDELRFHEAREKLAESYRLDPAIGTLLNLAVCNQAIGKSATAWKQFSEVSTMATKDDAERKAFADKRLAALRTKVNRVVIEVTEPLPALLVKWNGQPMAPSALGVPFMVDPGTYRATAEASGRMPWSVTVDVSGEGQTLRVVVPKLSSPPSPPPSPPPREPAPLPPPPDDDSAWPAVGWTVASVGAAAAVVGGILGIRAIVLADEVEEACLTGCTTEDVAKNDDAKSSALASNVLVGVGLGVMAAGVLTIVLTSETEPAAVAVRVGGSAITLTGSF